MLQFSVNNQFIGLGRMPQPTFCQAWFTLKQFLVSVGWTVSQSGYSNTMYGSAFGTSDLIAYPGYVAGGMASDNVWFVLRSPDGVRELLFYRHVPISTSNDGSSGSKISYRTAATMAIAYSASSKFSTSIGQGYIDNTYPSVQITSVNSGAGTAVLNIPSIGAENIGNSVVITNGSPAAKNNGTYLITAVSSGNITIANPLASVDTTGDLNAEIKILTAVSGSNPPMANDMIWLHRDDLADSQTFYTNKLDPVLDIVNWSGAVSTGDALNDYDIWHLHICAEKDTAPYPFYFWFTNKRNTLGFFCMDAMLEANSSDTDPVTFWFCPITGGIGGYSDYNFATYAQPTGEQWSPHYIQTDDTLQRPRLRGWINKPSAFSSRNDYLTKIGTNACRFLPITVPMLSTFITLDGGGLNGNEYFYPFAPLGNSTSLYSAQDQLFPVMYFKYVALQTYQEYNNPTIAQNGNLYSMPNVYKGRSTLMKMNSVLRNQFDTLTITTSRDSVICGSSREMVLPWNGTAIST